MKEPLINWVKDSEWFLLNFSAFILTILTPISILGLYAKQSEKMGKLGLIGFIMVYLGGMLYVGLQFDEAFTWPILAKHAPILIDTKSPILLFTALQTAVLKVQLAEADRDLPCVSGLGAPEKAVLVGTGLAGDKPATVQVPARQVRLGQAAVLTVYALLQPLALY